jgi:hypothetical protein
VNLKSLKDELENLAEEMAVDIELELEKDED